MECNYYYILATSISKEPWANIKYAASDRWFSPLATGLTNSENAKKHLQPTNFKLVRRIHRTIRCLAQILISVLRTTEQQVITI